MPLLAKFVACEGLIRSDVFDQRSMTAREPGRPNYRQSTACKQPVALFKYWPIHRHQLTLSCTCVQISVTARTSNRSCSAFRVDTHQSLAAGGEGERRG